MIEYPSCPSAQIVMGRRHFLGGSLSALAFTAAVSRTTRAEGPVVLPFEWEQGQPILIPITVNGHPTRAVVDSGASASIVDLAFANRVGASLGRTGRAIGISGQVPARQAQARIDLAGNPLHIRLLAALDLSGLTRDPSRPVQVILGKDLFDDRVVDLDFATRLMTLSPRRSFVAPGGSPLTLVSLDHLPSIPINLGDVVVPAVVDLGNAGSVVVDGAFAERYRLFAGRRHASVRIVGADGPRDGTVSTLAQIALGGAEFHDVPAISVAKLSGTVPVFLSLDLLSRFHIAIDFGGKRLWLRPYPDATEKPFMKDRGGMSLQAKGDLLVVSFVSEPSPASAGGWRVGDMIVAINGQSAAALTPSSPLAHWAFGPAGERIVFSMADGSKRTIILADYF